MAKTATPSRKLHSVFLPILFLVACSSGKDSATASGNLATTSQNATASGDAIGAFCKWASEVHFKGSTEGKLDQTFDFWSRPYAMDGTGQYNGPGSQAFQVQADCSANSLKISWLAEDRTNSSMNDAGSHDLKGNLGFAMPDGSFRGELRESFSHREMHETNYLDGTIELVSSAQDSRNLDHFHLKFHFLGNAHNEAGHRGPDRAFVDDSKPVLPIDADLEVELSNEASPYYHCSVSPRASGNGTEQVLRKLCEPNSQWMYEK